ncbi:MAG: superoxide dismutase [Patescibacteria group bacterium]
MPTKYVTPSLPYGYDALEPYLDAETVRIHHDKHHEMYTTKLNVAVNQHPELYAKSVAELLSSLDDVPEDIRGAVRNHGGGHLNHNTYWEVLGPKAGGTPPGELLSAIGKSFGSCDKFQAIFSEMALTVFGSGWVWLTTDGKKVTVEMTPNQDSPLSVGRTPLLALDVWEHAYYLQYRNLRADYIKAFWNVVNWDAVAVKFAATR